MQRWFVNLSLLIEWLSLPLKPQRQLHALWTVSVPCVYHATTLCQTNIVAFLTPDRTVSYYVRWWLHLPKEVPILIQYRVVDLGIPSLRFELSSQWVAFGEPRLSRSSTSLLGGFGSRTSRSEVRRFLQILYLVQDLEWKGDIRDSETILGSLVGPRTN